VRNPPDTIAPREAEKVGGLVVALAPSAFDRNLQPRRSQIAIRAELGVNHPNTIAVRPPTRDIEERVNRHQCNRIAAAINQDGRRWKDRGPESRGVVACQRDIEGSHHLLQRGILDPGAARRAIFEVATDDGERREGTCQDMPEITETQTHSIATVSPRQQSDDRPRSSSRPPTTRPHSRDGDSGNGDSRRVPTHRSRESVADPPSRVNPDSEYSQC